MLTKDEKELLEALKEHMDDEQREALSAASEEDIKGFLNEARKEIEKETSGQDALPDGCLAKLHDFKDCPWREVWNPQGRWFNGKGVIQAILLKLLLKILLFWW